MTSQTLPATQPLRWRNTTSAQRRTVIAAGLGWMLDAFDVMLYSIVLATLMREFGMTKTTAGLLNSLTLIASALGSFVFGYMADRAGRRRMLSISILTYSVFHLRMRLCKQHSGAGDIPFSSGLRHGRRMELRCNTRC